MNVTITLDSTFANIALTVTAPAELLETYVNAFPLESVVVIVGFIIVDSELEVKLTVAPVSGTPSNVT